MKTTIIHRVEGSFGCTSMAVYHWLLERHPTTQLSRTSRGLTVFHKDCTSAGAAKASMLEFSDSMWRIREGLAPRSARK